MDSKSVQNVQGCAAGGNTKPPLPSASKRWCFTWNNYPEDAFVQIVQVCKGFEWIAGKEVGENGTPHLQGYIESSSRFRPFSLGLPKTIHWEKCKGNRIQNLEYCAKQGDYQGTLKPPRPLKLINPDRPWQVDLLKILDEEPDDRTIHWWWESVGNVGKSAMTKYLCAKRGALQVGGKACDMKFMIAKHNEVKGFFPEIVIFDIPRENLDYLSYNGMEQIKNGCFASTKYESGMVVMNSPHVIVFANSEPDKSKVSLDRWRIRQIKIKEH